MRWIGLLVGLCLLCAGTAPKRPDHHGTRPHDEIAAVQLLAKVAVRRTDGARPTTAACGPGPFALTPLASLREPPRVSIEIVHAALAPRWLAAHDAFDARGPPVG